MVSSDEFRKNYGKVPASPVPEKYRGVGEKLKNDRKASALKKAKDSLSETLKKDPSLNTKKGK